MAKLKTNIKTMSVNKGISNHKNKKNVLINLVNSNKPDVLVISEANLEKEGETLDIDYPGFKVKSKFFGDDNPPNKVRSYL